MINSFKYVFVKTESSWFIGSFHHSLSFSSDGTTITGSTRAAGTPYLDDRPIHSDYRVNYDLGERGRVQLWETATGAATWSFERSSFLVFSPTDPDIAALVRLRSIHIMKRDSFGGKTWGGQTSYHCTPCSGCAFDSNGKTIVKWDKKHVEEHNLTTSSWSMLRNYYYEQGAEDYQITSVVCCPIKPGLLVVGVGDGQGGLDIVSYADGRNSKSLCRVTPINPARLSACAWSQDGKWIATGNDIGNVFLYNADVPTSVSFAMVLPRGNRPKSSNIIKSTVTSLVFLPDSTALIIISGGYLSVWDIEKVEYVTNSGLPDMAMNIALDAPGNRLAVAVNQSLWHNLNDPLWPRLISGPPWRNLFNAGLFTNAKITIYELKLREEMCQMDGRSSTSIPPPQPERQRRRWFNS